MDVALMLNPTDEPSTATTSKSHTAVDGPQTLSAASSASVRKYRRIAPAPSAPRNSFAVVSGAAQRTATLPGRRVHPRSSVQSPSIFPGYHHRHAAPTARQAAFPYVPPGDPRSIPALPSPFGAGRAERRLPIPRAGPLSAIHNYPHVSRVSSAAQLLDDDDVLFYRTAEWAACARCYSHQPLLGAHASDAGSAVSRSRESAWHRRMGIGCAGGLSGHGEDAGMPPPSPPFPRLGMRYAPGLSYGIEDDDAIQQREHRGKRRRC